jgi:hypothetical protein
MAGADTADSGKWAQMLAFVARAQASPFTERATHETSTSKVLDWLSTRRSRQARQERERVITAIEDRAAELVRSGAHAQWLLGADPHVAQVASTVNGPLAMELAVATGFDDPECIEALRQGAPALGVLPKAADAVPHAYPVGESAQELWDSCRVRNKALVESLRLDKHADFLLQQTVADVKEGRMTGPVKADTLDPDSVLLARRFSREQGKRADGSLKLRAVDDRTSNGVNECTQPQGEPVPESVDMLVRSMVALKTATGKN